MSLAIKAENISKNYLLLHEQHARYKSFRETIAQKTSSIFSKSKETNIETFWALKDINFEINQGDRVGIIGRNGAGKSTLLKILSRITSPTTGKISIDGRVASLLEVGTGFHPELSGRENIFLNGSILGMSRIEIRQKFDEIVSFSEIEKFLDTPVKRYSSGMYVRLAFAVAAHLEPEILIVDEVLAVGDAQFQKKCIGKMKDVANSGRTVLFVSHNMEVIQRLCNRGMLLQKGNLISVDEIGNVISKYMDLSSNTEAVFEINKPIDYNKLPGYAIRIQVEDEDGQLTHEIPVGKNWQVRILFKLNKDTEQFVIGLGTSTSLGLPLRTSWSTSENFSQGDYEVIFKNDDVLFSTGHYKLVVGLSCNARAFHYVEEAGSVYISEVSSLIDDHRIVNTQSGLILNPMKVEVNKL